MVDYRKKYQKIVDELIEESFPELRGRSVKVLEIPKWAVWWVGGFVFGRFIVVNSSVKKLRGKSLRGFFAHEVCHVEDSMKRNYFHEAVQFFGEIISWLFKTGFSFDVERGAELKTIRKGYGKDLYELALRRSKKMSEKKLKAVYDRGYLPPEKVKSYAKEVGEW